MVYDYTIISTCIYFLTPTGQIIILQAMIFWAENAYICIM